MAAVLLLTLAAPAAVAAERPNVLWLTCEDISPNLGCYGDDYARTPNLDQFAEQGILYTNAFGITGVCAVNRSCLITGMYSSTIGSQAMRSTTRLPAQIECYSEYLRRAGYYCTNNVKTDYNFATPKSAWDECSSQAHYEKRQRRQPFFAVFNYTNSHESRIRAPSKQLAAITRRLTPDQRHDPARVPLPPFHPDTPEVRRDWANYHDLITALDYWIADMLAGLEDAGLADNTIVWFYSDHGAGMPGCKKWVWQSGLRVPLIVHFPRKWRHLAPSGAGSRTDRLVSFLDFAPTLLSLASVTVPEHMQGVAFLGDQAGPPRQYVYGIRDRMAERYDIVRVVRDKQFQYIRNYLPHVSWSQYVSYTEQMPTMKVWRKLADEGKLRGPAARYFAPHKPVEELYHVTADPHQVSNLAGDPRYEAVLARMRTACLAFQKQTHDLGMLPEYEIDKRAAGRTPYDVAVDPQANPLPTLIAAASAANARDASMLPALIESMTQAADPAVRWWGTTGLAALGTQAKPAAEALLKAVNDNSPNVRIAAADALCNLGRYDEALPVLLDGLKHESSHIRLRALNALDRIGDHARPAAAAIKAAKMSPRTKGGAKDHVADYVNRMAGYVPQKFSP